MLTSDPFYKHCFHSNKFLISENVLFLSIYALYSGINVMVYFKSGDSM